MKKTKTKMKASKLPKVPRAQKRRITLGGRPPAENPQTLRRHRVNLLLDDAEFAVWERFRAEVAEHEGRAVKGAEIMRRQHIPHLRRLAERYGMPLNAPKADPKSNVLSSED